MVSQMVCRNRRQEAHDLHAGVQAGLDAGAGVFEDEAVGRGDTELGGGAEEAFGVRLALADLVDRGAREGVEDDRLYRLLSACGRALKADPDNALGILAYAEHWLLHCMGLLPHPRVCGRCGNDEAPLVLLSPEVGWCCAACTPTDPREALPPGSRDFLRQLRTLGAESAPRVDPDHEAQRVLTALLRARLLQELGGGLRSYEVLWKSL